MEIKRKILPDFSDPRGFITKILDGENVTIKSILRITSKAGSIRANHYHKKDAHYTYFVSGMAEFYEKPVDGEEIEYAVVEAGDLVYTPPMRIHAVRFLEDSEFFAFATESRNQEDYEEDTIRVKLID